MLTTLQLSLIQGNLELAVRLWANTCDNENRQRYLSNMIKDMNPSDYSCRRCKLLRDLVVSRGGANMLLFTEKLNRLYNEVKAAGNQFDLRFELVKSGDMVDAGSCTLKKHPDSVYIEIKIREDRLTEDALSHELLHALFIQKGFGQTGSNSIEGIPFQQIAVLLHSVIEHRSIYALQIGMGIDIVPTQKHKAATIFKNIAGEPPIVDYSFVVNALLLLDCLIGANEYRDLFMQRIMKLFPHTYELAERLEKGLFTEDIDTPPIYRRTFIKGLEICDEFLRQHILQTAPYLKLQENISISYLPSEIEMQQKVREVFDFRETFNSFIIISKKDKQASYILTKANNIDNIMNMTVEDFILKTDRIKPQNAWINRKQH